MGTMTMRPLLDLKQITIDSAMVGRIPYGMALYYMALPLAYEEDCASVVIAHPENDMALTRLRDLLGMEVVSVRGERNAIYAALQQFHPNHTLPMPKILAWTAPTATVDGVRDLASLFGTATATEVTMPVTSNANWESLLATVSNDRYSLAVIPAYEANTHQLLRWASSPILLAGEEIRPVKRILIVLRGYSSDDYALEWLIPLLRHTGAAVTLIPILDSALGQMHQMLNGKGSWREHMRNCLQQLGTNGVHAHLKLREGNPVEKIANETGDGDYDLLVIPAEGYGEFVGNVLEGVARHSRGVRCPVLVMKPPCK